MKNKYAFLLSLFLCCYCGKIKSQSSENFISSDYNSYYFNPQNIGLSDPQVTDFIKYGNLNMNHYNGLLDMEIPLDGYQDNDFDLPISLKYVSTGFIPSKRPSIVGYNWFLNCGGVISRTVKGSPDDTKGKYVNNNEEYIKDGLLVAIRNNTFKIYTEQELLEINVEKNSSDDIPYAWGDFRYDMEPDIFNFSFGKHSGSFIIGNNGEVVSLSGEGYLIDISELHIQEYSTTSAPGVSRIKIFTPDGYIYEFGGTRDYLEYFIPNNPNKMVKRSSHITSWFLKSIQAPNNRKIEFTYQSKELANYYNYFLYSYYHERIANRKCPGSPLPNRDTIYEQIEVKDNVFHPLLTTIKIDNIEIKFNTIRASSFFKDTDYSFLLSTIAFYSDSQKIRETSFSYSFKEKYSFLSKIISNNKKYEFEYNLSHTLPSPLTISLDHWGYWNGGYDLHANNIKNYCENIENNKMTIAGYHDVALLSKIKYPTGGISEIIYEPNSYNRYVEKDLSTKGVNLLSSANEILCGGARVYQIEDYDPINDKSYLSKTFQYIVPQTGKGSGLIGNKPKYKIAETMREYKSYGDSCGETRQFIYIDISANTLGFNENIPDNHITYSDVIENQTNGYTHYHYTSYADINNSIEHTKYLISRFPRKYVAPSTSTNLTELEIAEKSNLYKTNDRSRFRGKLKTKYTYDSFGEIRQKEIFRYNLNELFYTYHISLASTFRGRSAYKIYTTPCLLVEKEVIDENDYSYIEYYRYNNKSIIAEQKTVNSNGDSLAVRYKYVTDYEYDSLDDACKALFNKNMVNRPLEITKVSSSYGSPEKTFETIRFNYKLNNERPVPADVKMKKNNQWVKIMEYPHYNEFDYPVHTIENENLHTVYLRGFRGQRILAKILNASYEEVDAKRSSLNLSLYSLTDAYDLLNDSFRKLNQLREALPKAQTTIYTYYPLIGIKSVTDPRGISTYYSYDNAGRLKERYQKKTNDLHNLKYMLDSYNYNYLD